MKNFEETAKNLEKQREYLSKDNEFLTKENKELENLRVSQQETINLVIFSSFCRNFLRIAEKLDKFAEIAGGGSESRCFAEKLRKSRKKPANSRKRAGY